MNERIRELRKVLGLTQQEFADRLGVKRNTIAQYETGRNSPIEAIITSICREFGVNESWLRTGEGEMLVNLDEQKKIAAFRGDLMREEDSSFKTRFIQMLSEMGPDEWALLEKMARRLTGQ